MAYNTETKIRGGTDNTIIGNTGNSLNVNFQSSEDSPIYVSGSASNKATYSANIYATQITTTTPTDCWTFAGSSTKIVKILRFSFEGTKTTSSSTLLGLMIRHAVNTGGTYTYINAVPHDSLNPPATAYPRYYTVNPTSIPTGVGYIASRRQLIAADGTLTTPWVLDFERDLGQPIVLRGTSEVLCLTGGSVSLLGNSCHIGVTWTEE